MERETTVCLGDDQYDVYYYRHPSERQTSTYPGQEPYIEISNVIDCSTGLSALDQLDKDDIKEIIEKCWEDWN